MQELAYQVLGDRVTIWRSTRPTSGVGELVDGLSSTGEGLEVKVVQNASTFARRARLLKDAEGGVLLVELDTRSPSVVAEIALYAYGDVRTSNVALQRVQERQSAFK